MITPQTLMSLAPVVIFIIASLTLVFPAEQAPRPPDTSAKAVAAAAEHYVDDYQKQLSYLLAEEDGTQEIRMTGTSGPPRQRRTTKAEVFLTFLNADRVWLSVRDVTEVDGRPLTQQKDLRALLTAGPLVGLARTLAEEGSRFNIGRVYRNFNEPTLGLLVLDEKHRAQFKFDRKKVDPSDTGPIVTLAFTEKDTPTLIHGDNGRSIFSRGEMVIEAATGRVRQTSIQIDTGTVHATLTTTFVADTRLDMWVPDTLTERYEDTGAFNVHETTVCESKYTNYKRFDVQVRIK
jgi:hypothetical protein